MASKSVVITNYRTLPGIISETKRYYMFPTLTYPNRNGAQQFWQIYVGMLAKKPNGKYKAIDIEDYFFDNTELEIDLIAVIKVDAGVVGGKTREAADTYVTEGKNIGKKNETNVFCQALRNALSKYNKQHDKVAPSELIHPMLAQEADSLKLLPYPVFVQRKYNGNRMLSHMLPDGSIKCYSRNLKPTSTNANIISDIILLLSAAEQEPKLAKATDLFFDGEVYEHGKSLQQLGSLRSKKGADVITTRYYTYDIYDKSRPGLTFSERLDLLTELYSRVLNNEEEPYEGVIDKNYIIDDEDHLNYCILADTFEASNASGVRSLYHQFLNEKYEGAMIKLADAIYEPSLNAYKSKNILKLKPKFDEEYEVVGISGEGAGKSAGALMVTCALPNGTEFDVTPALPLDTRRELFEKYSNDEEALQNELLGKKIIVTFDEKSDLKVPLRGRTKLEIRKDV